MSSPHDSTAPESVEREYSLENQDQPLLAIVEAVTEVTDRTYHELVPLQRAIDVEALTELLDSERAGSRQSTQRPSPGMRVRFRYEGCQVEVGRTVVHARAI